MGYSAQTQRQVAYKQRLIESKTALEAADRSFGQVGYAAYGAEAHTNWKDYALMSLFKSRLFPTSFH